MSTFGFKINLTDSDVKILSKGGYVLAVQKSYGGSTAVQWITADVTAREISVHWTESYSLFMTTSELNNGAVIDMTEPSPTIALGQNYTYTPGSWAGASGTAGSTTVFNGLKTQANYGIAQEATVNGLTTNQPLGVSKNVLPGGNVSFTPLEEVVIYFSNSYTSPGCIIEAQSKQQPATLVAGTVPTFTYNASTGQWSGGSAEFEAERLNAAGNGWFQYVLTFTGKVARSVFDTWLQGILAKGISYQVLTFEGVAVTITLSAPKDQLDLLKSHKGDQLPSSVTSRVKEGVWAVKGSVVTLKDVTEQKTQATVLWNRLEALSRVGNGHHHNGSGNGVKDNCDVKLFGEKGDYEGWESEIIKALPHSPQVKVALPRGNRA